MKICITLFCFLFAILISDPSHSQAPVKVWDKTIGGSGDDRLMAISSTSDGGYLLGGYSYSNASGDKTENNKGGSFSDYWIVKINSSGQKVWDKTFGGNSSDELISIVATSDGGYLLAGLSFSNVSGDKTENSKGWNDYWIVKINASGQKVWDKTFGGSGSDALTSIISSSDGGYLLAGNSYSNVSGDKSENNKGDLDYWVIKINALGQKEWDKTIGGSYYDHLTSIISTPDDGYLLGGISYSDISGDKTENSKGNDDSDYWIVKINASGQKVWDKTIGGTGNDILMSVISSSDGGYLLAGNSVSNASEDKTENSKSSLDYWIVKINASGQKVWDKTFGGSSEDNLNSAVAGSDGGYLLGGYSYSDASGDKSENNRGERDYWIVKVNSSGQKVWDKSFGGSNFNILNSLTSTSDSGYLLGGWSNSNISGDKTENSKGGADYWIVKIAEPCPTLTTAPANVTITNSSCSANCTLTTGSITAPTNACPAGSVIEYSTNNGTSWTKTLPVYNQSSAVVIRTRCQCQSDTTVVSPVSVSVTTSPGSCQLPDAPVSGGNQSVTATNPIQTLTAAATAPAGSTVKWYDAANAGNVVAIPTWNTIGTKTYYASSKNNTTNCESTTRTSVILEIKSTTSVSYIEFGINNTHDPNAIFEVHSSNKGILFPRIDYNNRPTTNLTNGLLIYVILNGPQGNNCFYYWNGTSWAKLGN